ncbi:hypothetical protein P4E94_02470 [Pontiellaceae bacterium B12219]|nr:hypothetical protein [Pontiellaceae bacterium B12219]
MIVVCDINEIWRKKPFAAMAEKNEVLGISPADWIVAKKRGFASSEGALEVLPIALPPSWASRFARVGQRILWNRIKKACTKKEAKLEGIVLTSPHYLPLLDLIPKKCWTAYYASDDYRSYEGWGKIAELEKQMVQRVDHAFFVSHGLMERARDEYGVNADKLSVSMNATESRFKLDEETGPVAPPKGDLRRPVAGVVGGINERLDFDLLYQCAELPDLGTLLLVGPVPENPSTSLQKLLHHPKCVAVGRQPHETIHQWFQCLDVGLIPYVATPFNRMCSPMRLFDHMASGSAVVATAACDQVRFFKSHISVCQDNDSFVKALQREINGSRINVPDICWSDRADVMQTILKGLPCE